MKKIKLILILLVSVLTINSCDSDYQEINTDPDNPTAMPAELFLAGVLRSEADIITSSFLAGEAASEWAQHLSKVVYNDADYYIPRKAAIQNLWDISYGSVLKDATVMQNLAFDQNNSDLQGVALVLKAFSYQVLSTISN